jgi:hypothetical protein
VFREFFSLIRLNSAPLRDTVTVRIRLSNSAFPRKNAGFSFPWTDFVLTLAEVVKSQRMLAAMPYGNDLATSTETIRAASCQTAD